MEGEGESGGGGSFLQSSDDPLHVSLMYGCVTGVTCVGVGYPLDTAKVRLQVGQPFGLALLQSPYRGVLSPLLAVPPAWSANFLMYGLAIKGLGSDSIPSVMAAGAVAGLGYAVACCPFEMVKCNTQGSKAPLLETSRRLWHERGAGMLYRGFLACVARDVGQGAAYYGLAESLGRSEYLQGKFGAQAPFLTGMLTGLGHCHVELPFDCIKTRMHTNWQYRGYRDCLREVFRDGLFTGIRTLYKGYLPWMSRAMICHGSSFWVITQVRIATGL